MILVAGAGGVFGKVPLASRIGNAIAVVLAMGAGVLALSHMNDAGYLMFTKLTDLDMAAGLRTWRRPSWTGTSACTGSRSRR